MYGFANHHREVCHPLPNSNIIHARLGICAKEVSIS